MASKRNIIQILKVVIIINFRDFTLAASNDKIQPELSTEASDTRDKVPVHYNSNITLHQACKKGRLDVVKYILSHGLEDINCRGRKRRTPVMVAVSKGQIAVFDYLISRGCDLSAVDENKNGVLHFACIRGNIDIVRKLIVSKKCDIESRGAFGRRPVMWASCYGHREVFKLLVEKGCDLNAVDNENYNILHQACLVGPVDMVQYILSQNVVSIESRGYHGRTPVMSAAVMGNKKAFDFLVERGCNLTAVADTKDNILHLACHGGHVDIVQYILSQNIISIESRGRHGKTPVMTAAAYGNKNVFDYLVERGCNLTAVTDTNDNILHVACRGGHVDMVQYILSQKIVSIESRGYLGRTPVMSAAVTGNKNVFDFLVVRGCDLTAVDNTNDNILHMSCYFGHVNIVKRVLAQEVISIDDRGQYGMTPVMKAVWGGCIEICDLLNRKDCNLLTMDVHKNNILHVACYGGHARMVKYLMTLRAVEGMEKMKNKDGEIPVQVAERRGHVAVVSFLEGRK